MGIDPGQKGAFSLIDSGSNEIKFKEMPLKNENVDFEAVRKILIAWNPDIVFLERAMPMAMGAKHAFNYGRGFAALELAIQIEGFPVVYVEPAKWPKQVLDGIDSRLKPKARSLIAFERLYPDVDIVRNKKGAPHDGMVDALLIAHYGLSHPSATARERGRPIDGLEKKKTYCVAAEPWAVEFLKDRFGSFQKFLNQCIIDEVGHNAQLGEAISEDDF